MNTVRSNNVIIELLVSGAYYPVFCGKTMEYTQNQETVEVTSINSGSAREYVSGMTTASLSIAGITIIDNTGNRIAITYLMQESIRRTAQTLRIRMIADNATAIQIAFLALITSNTLSRAVGTYSQSSTSMIITGEPVISAIIPPPGLACVEDPLYLATTPGQTKVHSVLLEQVGVEILAVEREGLGQVQVSGTPGSGTREFLFVGGAGNGDIFFDPGNPFNTGEIVYVLYKIV